jgi:hypothetical protein
MLVKMNCGIMVLLGSNHCSTTSRTIRFIYWLRLHSYLRAFVSLGDHYHHGDTH